MKKYLNPYRMFLGAFLPNWLLKNTEITPSEKLTYARLCQFSGKDGRCFPKIDTIAQEIGLEERQVQRNLQRLEESGLIEVIRRPPQVNEYRFLWCHARQVEGVRHDTLKVTSTTPSIYEENHIRESYKSITFGGESLPLQTCLENNNKVTLSNKSKLPIMPKNFLPDVLAVYGTVKGWTDKPNVVAYKRFARAVKDLFIISNGDMEKITKTISWVSKQGYEWSLDTVVKKWYDANKKSKAELLPEL